MSFDRLAPHYTWMEMVLAGSRLQRARIAFLSRLAGCERLLIAGVGHGHFLRACAECFPTLEICSVDASAGMLRRAQRRVAGIVQPGRLHFVHATLPAWQPPPAAFDAIATHFFLDCFAPAELAAVVATLNRAAPTHATWLLSDFTVPPHGWRHHRARVIHRLMYAFFRPVTGLRAQRVTPPDSYLQDQGFHLAQRRTFSAGLLHADHWTRA